MRLNTILLTAALAVSCSDGNPTSPRAPSPEQVRASIISSYRGFTNSLIAQDYERALTYCVPGGNAEGLANVSRNMWRDGWQFYPDFYEVDPQRYSPDRGVAEVAGNVEYVQFKPTVGDRSFTTGFFSGARLIQGNWRIDGINNRLEVDWWKD